MRARELDSKAKSNLLVLCLLAVGFIMRFYHINAKSVWYDEAYYLWRIMWGGGLSFSYIDTHLLFYPFVIKIWTAIFGESAFAVRFFSSLIGILSLFIIFKVSEAIANKTVGVISVVFLVFSPFHIFYSQEIGEFSLFLLLVLFWVYLTLKILQDRRNNVLYYFLLGIVVLLNFWTHYYAIFFLVSYSVFLLTQLKNKKKKVIYIYIVILVSFLITFVPLSINFFKNKRYLHAILSSQLCWIPRYSLSEAFGEMINTFSWGGKSYGGYDFFIPDQDIKVGWLLSLIFISLIVMGLLGKDKNKKFIRPLLLLWASTGIWAWLFSKLVFPIFLVRHLIFALPAFYILAALGIESIRRIHLRIWIVVFILVLEFFPLSYYYKNELKIPWKKIIHYLQSKKKSSDELIIFNPFFQSGVLCFNVNPKEVVRLCYMRVPVDFLKERIENKHFSDYFISRKKMKHFISPLIKISNKMRVFLIETRWANTCVKVLPSYPLSNYDKPQDPDLTRNWFTNLFDKEEEVIFDYRGNMITSWNNFKEAFYKAQGVYIGIFTFNPKNNFKR